MANHKSALKRAKQSEKKRIRNIGYKTKVKHAVKQVRTAIAEGAEEKARENMTTAVSIIQKTASKGIIHKKTAARKISRLTRHINQLSSS